MCRTRQCFIRNRYRLIKMLEYPIYRKIFLDFRVLFEKKIINCNRKTSTDITVRIIHVWNLFAFLPTHTRVLHPRLLHPYSVIE